MHAASTHALELQSAMQMHIRLQAAFSQVVGAGAPVQNLGVVGRGSKRITLQPAAGAHGPAA